ncbi:mannitol-1-phosphate 5-dehydrogenase [Paenibacillus beijingensis]|uniref:Mannitol-1-phosphate 5-dehydrogenase n=1 Tax=Paenibacillus beijingensis TaxID=1126833 RepID=A0A0D5NS43_9BACL|nr:mannitol-1-phosphate 5-dehydrogenase [Paenibacillus beijingensis]
MPSKKRKAVHFGAGNIGRGFIGMMLSNSGYEVCFVARNETQIELLQQKKQYTVTYANENEDTEIVKNVTAVQINNRKDVNEHITEAELLTTAVGVSALPSIAKVIAQGIEKRLRHNTRPLHVIACENAVGGSSLLKKWVYQHLSAEARAEADRLISFPDSTIDRIVPAQKHEDPLAIKVEPFYEWVIDRSGFQNGFQEIEGAKYADSLEPFVERKLFTVNTGHCCAAYFGFLEGFQTIQQALKDPALETKVRQVLEETGQLLIHKYHLNPAEHRKYIDKTLERFKNPAITDKVFRVGRSPLRKLSHNDRLVRPLIQAHERGLKAPHLTSAIAAALLFNNEKDPEAVEMQSIIEKKGISHFIAQRMGIAKNHAVHSEIVAAYEQLK